MPHRINKMQVELNHMKEASRAPPVAEHPHLSPISTAAADGVVAVVEPIPEQSNQAQANQGQQANGYRAGHRVNLWRVYADDFFGVPLMVDGMQWRCIWAHSYTCSLIQT